MVRKLHVVLHVPKCAGRTIEDHLFRHLGNKRFWNPGKRTRSLPLEILDRKYDATPPGSLDDIEAISGHLIGRSIERMFPDRKIIRSVILRDPEKQIMSWYNYRMMRYISQGLHPFPFDVFVRSFPTNPVAYFLLERWFELPWIRHGTLSPEKKVALLDEELSKFDRIVDISEANNLCAWLSGDLSIPLEPNRTNTSEEWASRTGWKLMSFRDLTDRQQKLLRNRFTIDRYLWRRWALKEDVVFERSDSESVLAQEFLRPLYEARLRLARRFGW